MKATTEIFKKPQNDEIAQKDNIKLAVIKDYGDAFEGFQRK